MRQILLLLGICLAVCCGEIAFGSSGLKTLKHVDVLGVSTGMSKLSDVKTKVGIAEEQRRGDASSSDHYLCYRGSDGTIAKFSSDELGGGTILTGVSIYKDRRTFEVLPSSDISYVDQYVGHHQKAVCGTSNEIDKNLFKKLGLVIGMRSEIVQKILGRKSKEFDGYSIEIANKPAKCNTADHSTVRIWTHVEKGKLDGVGFFEGLWDPCG